MKTPKGCEWRTIIGRPVLIRTRDGVICGGNVPREWQGKRLQDRPWEMEKFKEIIVTTVKPVNEMTTEELVRYVKSMGKDVQSSYGLFVANRNLSPEISMREFKRIWDSVTPYNFKTQRKVKWKPTHIIYGIKTMFVSRDENKVNHITDAGSVASDPVKLWDENAKPI
jgi:hypothetical protein